MTDFLDQLTGNDAPGMREVGAAPAIVGGKGFCRLVGVIVLGKQPGAFNNQPKYRNEIRLVYELYAKQWPTNEQGLPPLKSETLTYSMSDRARMRQRWSSMDPEGRTHNLFQLLLKPFLITLKEKKSGKGHTYVQVDSVEEAAYQNPATGAIDDFRDGNKQGNKVPGPAHNIMAFNYDSPSIEQWNSLFIPGKRDDGSSLNSVQNAVRTAIRFDGSPMAQILTEMGRDIWADYDEHGQIIPGSREANLKYVREWTAYKNGQGPFPGGDGGSSQQPSAVEPATAYGQQASLAAQTGHAPAAMPPAASVPPSAVSQQPPAGPPAFTGNMGSTTPQSAPPSPAGNGPRYLGRL